ncbi:MAG: hypothetical protein ACRDJF_02525 [Actinomycetota bacterium]
MLGRGFKDIENDRGKFGALGIGQIVITAYPGVEKMRNAEEEAAKAWSEERPGS